MKRNLNTSIFSGKNSAQNLIVKKFKRFSRTSYSGKAQAVLIILLSAVITSFAQQERRPTRGYQAGNAYSLSDIESINLTNGNLIMNIPLASLPAGRGIGYTVALRYNNKLWNAKQKRETDGNPDEVGNRNYMRELIELSDQGGWHLDTGGHRLEVINRLDLEEQAQCVSGNGYEVIRNGYRFKMEMQFPDGSVKEFRPYGDGLAYQDTYEDGWFSIDPAGVRHMHGFLEWSNGDGTSSVSCNYTISQVTTAGMNYYTNDGSGIRLFIPYGQSTGFGISGGSWTMYYPDGRVVENKPVNDSTSYQRITDRNGNQLNWRGATVNGISGVKIENGVGQYIFVGSDSNNDSKIIQPGVGGTVLETTAKWKSNWIYRNYKTTDALNSNSAKIYEDVFLNFSGLDKIILPPQAGSLEYSFTYNASATQPSVGSYTSGWGELKSVTLPSGAKADYKYQLDGNAPVLGNFDVLNNSVRQRDLTYQNENDGSTTPVTETWYYSGGYGDYGSVTNPDGSGVTEISDFHGSLKGYAYRTANSDGSLVERIWAHNIAPRVKGKSDQAINAYVKTEFNTIADNAGNPSLTAIKDYTYDKNGNVLEIKEYDWMTYASVPRQDGKVTGLPSGLILKRKTINSYYYATPDAADSTTDSSNHYANPASPALVHLIKSTEIQNANGNATARTEYYYDDNSVTPTKGNLAETRTWDSTKQATLPAPDTNGYKLSSGNSVITTAIYDQYGNPTLVTDTKGYQTQITYGAVGGYLGLYPTQTEAAYQTSVQRTSTAAYDFNTGLVTSTTDVDNALTNATEYDALGRPLKVKAAVGTTSEIWTQTEYNDTLRRVVSRSDLFVKGDGKKIAVQHYDQLGRMRLSRSIENAATQDPYNENDGIKVQARYQTGNPYSYQWTSNPYRAATSSAATGEESMGWTRSKSSNTGRHSEIETFTGAAFPDTIVNSSTSTGIVSTDIDADRTLVSDQAGKQRMSRTNALGQLVNVWEIKAAETGQTEAISFGSPAVTLNGYKTSYAYDTLNNLTTVNQGAQTRNFTYSTLSRLKTANNPESGLISYGYDDNGNLTSKTDARPLTTTYTYDALNRVKTRNYSDSGITPNVTYTYDNLTNAKGRLTKVESSVSKTEYQIFDVLGRVTQSQQWVDGTAYGNNPMTYKYNLSGALIEEKYPSGRVVKNVLDNDGDLSIVQSSKNAGAGYFNYAKNFTYTAAGAVGSMQLGNGKWESTSFNSRLQPTQIALGTTQGGTDKLKLDFTYNTTGQANNNGNVLSQTITVPTVGGTSGFTATQTYNYDSLNRLKDATEMIGGSQSWKQAYTYDRYGNRQFDTTINNSVVYNNSLTDLSNCPTNICNPTPVTGNNRLNGYSYDDAGNTKTDAEGRTFTYDAENKQTEVKNSSNASLGQYTYDGDGKRVKKYLPSSGETTIFIYDASARMVAEYSTTVEPAATARVSYLTNDHLGSPRITTDRDGKVFSRRDFMPFGEEITLTPTTQRSVNLNYGEDGLRQKFTSYERDNESGLDFGQARYYSSSLGRFYSVDPENAGASADNPQTWNAYAYVGNNPINITDPTGLNWYFNKELNEYKWYGDKDTVDKGYVGVVGNNGQAGSFSYEAQDGTFVTLDPYSNNYQTNIASKEDAIKLGDRLYQYSPEKRASAAGFNKNYDRNMNIVTAMAIASGVVIAAPVVATAIAGGAAPIVLGLTETATVAAPTGVAALNQLANQAQYVEKLTSKTQFVFQGNAQQIFDKIAQGATRIGPKAVKLSDGRIVSIYESSKAGPLQGPTIQVMDAGIKYVYRIKP